METHSQEISPFFGRSAVRAVFEKRLGAFRNGFRQNVGILSPPGLGKTSLARFFLRKVSGTEIIPIFIPLLESDSFHSFSRRWMSGLIAGCHQAMFPSESQSVRTCVRRLKTKIPLTIRKMGEIKKLVSHRRDEQAYRELLHLTAALHQESSQKIVVVLDDFDRLSGLGMRDPFADFGRAMMLQKETMFVITSSKPALGRSIVREKLALLFGNFELIELQPFDFEESNAFIEERTLGRPLSGRAKNFLIRLTDGSPYYLDVLTRRLKLFRSELEEEELLTRAVQAELCEAQGELYQQVRFRICEWAEGNAWALYADVLAAAARGFKKLPLMVRSLRRKPGEVERVLERLVEVEAVRKRGPLFTVPDPLLRFWLKSVHARTRLSLESTRDADSGALAVLIGAAVDESRQADGLELPKRMERLIRKFHNEAVEIGGRKFKCPQFDEVRSRPNNGRVFPVAAKNAQGEWLCLVLSNTVGEEDVRTFLQDVKGLRGPVRQKMIFGLRGIDLNAKLLAQEAKIQYLDLRNLNELLDLYDEPKIIV